MYDDLEPLFPCQVEACRTECSFHAGMLRLWNDKPICEDCYDAVDWPHSDDDPLSFHQLPPFVPAYQQTIERLQAELAEAKASEERAWRERNVAYAKVKAWEAVVYVEGLPLRAVRVDEWGPGEGEQTTVPDVTPKRLTELLDELAAIRERT